MINNYAKTSLFCLLLLLSLSAASQTFTDSNLPIVLINTDGGASIVDDPKIGASMKIIYRGAGQRNYVSDQTNAAYLNYNGRIAIEIRGSFSQTAPKKAYGFETRKDDNVSNRNVSLLDMPSENDWILNGLAFDPTLLHDYIANNLSRNIGQYATRTVFCEVVLNGAYNGIYLLQEKIKQDDNRVNITEMLTTDNASPNVTGGYIIKADKTTGGDPVAFTMSSNTQTVEFIHDTPEPAVITSQQKAYIESVFRNLETQSSANNASKVNGFPSIIDIPSFIDYMLINEISSCVDAYQYSTYFHQDRGGKLRAGPVWDFNFAFGLVKEVDGRSGISEWQFNNGTNEGPKFFKQIFNNPDYRCYIAKRWNELIQPGQPLNIDLLDSWIDSLAALLTESEVRENQKWNTINNFPNQISFLKSFIRARSTWITANINSSSTCTFPAPPGLVINEIMYNPKGTADNASNDLEFIEIKNKSNSSVDLTGIYFSGLGLSYQFPANTSLAAGGILVLASNSAKFNTVYAKSAFGQYTRNLSNKSQKLVLSDAFGNTIDVVEYFDSAPWPTSADGGGKSLELKEPNLDNSLASNWQASSADNGSPGVNNFNPLPVTIISFTGTAEAKNVVLNWEVTAEINVDKYVVELSRNGKNFTAIGTVKAGNITKYSFIHTEPASGTNYYRLRPVDMDNSFAFSRIISVIVENGNDIVFYPNPASTVLTHRYETNFYQ
ncbi:CotH kinase family protein [Dyadobacter subterraneus]|uniref:CotH kinase family protein n=1 Tax=Dyadobacter subterraneus TaxID=2773304 RepID=A0ABR9WG75_9BACT|nr:CotH kinase family protein [Dyadobacter subterraneus]MBE9464510.1 CotH kinase family protein [Dyadobacter subterraneus]